MMHRTAQHLFEFLRRHAAMLVVILCAVIVYAVLRLTFLSERTRLTQSPAPFLIGQAKATELRVQTEFRLYQGGILDAAERVGRDTLFRQALAAGDSVAAAKAFLAAAEAAGKRFSDISLNELNFNFYDTDARPSFWSGRASGLSVQSLRRALSQQRFSAIVSGDIYTDLIIVLPVFSIDTLRGLMTAGALTVGCPIDLNYRFNNRYQRNISLAQYLSKKVGAAVSISLDSIPVESLSGDSAAGSIATGGESLLTGTQARLYQTAGRGINNKPLFTMLFGFPAAKREHSLIDAKLSVLDCTARGIAVCLAALGAASLLLRWFRSTVRPLPATGTEKIIFIRQAFEMFIVSLLIWGTRYLLLAIDFPSLPLGMVLPPDFFSNELLTSKYGNSLSRSLGELTVSSVFLVIEAAYLFGALGLVQQHIARYAVSNRSRLAALAAAAAVAAAVVLILRMYAAILNSLVIDASVDFIDPFTVLSGYPLAVINLNLFFITLSVFALAAVLLSLQAILLIHLFSETSPGDAHGLAASVQAQPKFYAAIETPEGSAIFSLLSISVVAATLFLWIDQSRSLSAAQIFFFYLFGLAAAWRVFMRLSGRRNAVFRAAETSAVHFSLLELGLFGCLAAAAAYNLLYLNVAAQRSESLSGIAARSVLSEDSFSKETLWRLLSEMSGDAGFAEALSESVYEPSDELAFTLWANTTLSQESLDCSITVYDAERRVLGTFLIGAPTLWSKAAQRQKPLLTDSLFISVAAAGEYILPEKLTVLDAGKPYQVYTGITAFSDGDGRTLGFASVSILSQNAASIQKQQREQVNELLISYDRGRSDNFLYSYSIAEFRGGVPVAVSQASGGNYFVNAELPPNLAVRLQQSNPFSTREVIGGENYHTVYVRDPAPRRAAELPKAPASAPASVVSSGGQTSRVLAFRQKEIEVKWHLFAVLKLSLFNTLVILFSYTIFFLITFLSRRESWPKLAFRQKLYAGFLLSSLIPILMLGSLSRSFIATNSQEALEQNLIKDLDVLVATLQRTGVSKLTPADAKELSQRLKTDFSIFTVSGEVSNGQPSVAISSRDELYQTAILDRRLPGTVYRKFFLERQTQTIEQETLGGFPYLVGYRCLRDAAGRVDYVVSAPAFYRQKSIELETAVARATIFTLYGLVLVAASLAVGFFSRAMSSPITALSEALSDLSLTRENRRLTVPSAGPDDDIGRLINSYNRMIEDLEASKREVSQMERELAWREMARQIAHEIKNPLTPMKLNTQLLRQAYLDRHSHRAAAGNTTGNGDDYQTNRAAADARFKTLFDKITESTMAQIDALTRIADEFSRFAKMPRRNYSEVNLGEVINEAAGLFSGSDAVILRRFPDGAATDSLVVYADRDELRRVYINLIKNAMQSFATSPLPPAERTVTLELRLAGEWVVSRVADNGAGISEVMQPKIFEPNFSTKTDGTGLGLAISKKIITDLGGKISFTSGAEGTTFEILLPVIAER